MKIRKANLSALLLLFIAIVGLAVGQTESPSQSELIHLGDLVEVDVVGSYEYDWRGSLTPEGFLEGLDTIEEQIYALCRTEDQVAASIQKEYSKILRDPKVVVRILDRSNRAVAFVSGAVRAPQRFQIKRTVYLNELLVLSGGITDRSSGEISIFRPTKLNCTEASRDVNGEFVNASQSGGSEMLRIKIADILRGEPAANPQILSGDIVTVSEAFPVYVIGGVNSPQQISLRNQLSLSRAIATAGGLAKEGGSNVSIFRREAGETKIIKADLEKIAAGQGDDPILKAFDVIDVPQKGKPARLKPPVIDSGYPVPGSLAALPLRVID